MHGRCIDSGAAGLDDPGTLWTAGGARQPVYSQGADHPGTWAGFGESQLHGAAHPLTRHPAISLVVQQVSPSRPVCKDPSHGCRPGWKVSRKPNADCRPRSWPLTSTALGELIDEDAIFTGPDGNLYNPRGRPTRSRHRASGDDPGRRRGAPRVLPRRRGTIRVTVCRFFSVPP